MVFPDGVFMIKKEKKSPKWLKRGFVALCVLVCCVGILFLLIDPLKVYIRGQYTDRAIDAFKKGESTFEVPDNDALAVDGEHGEEEISAGKFFLDLGSMSDQYETLAFVGLLEIPCVEIEEPVFRGVSYNALRFGTGIFPGTADPGEAGLCSIWGHRVQGGNANLDRLEELQDHIGDKVYVTTMDYVRREYEIVETRYCKDADVMPWMYKETYDEEMLAIVTCGYGTNYKGAYHAYNTEFIVICKPVGTEVIDYG